jgi:DNA-binding NarL/FixJ family response regulator
MAIEGLKNALGNHPGIRITGAYRSGAELILGLKKEVPDVLLLDLRLPDKSGKELAPILLKQYPALNILVLSGLESPAYVKEMMDKGCKGYLFKSTTDQDTLLKAIRRVQEGRP